MGQGSKGVVKRTTILDLKMHSVVNLKENRCPNIPFQMTSSTVENFRFQNLVPLQER